MNHCVRCKLQNPLKSLKLKIATLIGEGKYEVYSKFSLPLRLFSGAMTIFVIANIFLWQSEFPFLLGMLAATIVVALRLHIFIISVTNKHSMPDAYSNNENDSGQLESE